MLYACPAVPRSIPKDSAAYLTGVAPADGTGACPNHSQTQPNRPLRLRREAR